MKVQIVGVVEMGSPASSGARNETAVVTWWRVAEAGITVKVGGVKIGSTDSLTASIKPD